MTDAQLQAQFENRTLPFAVPAILEATVLD